MRIKQTRVNFAKNHHVNTNGERLDFSQAHFIKGLYNSIAPEIVVIGGTQVMKTEWLLIDHLATAYEGFNVFFVLRNGEARDAYVQSRINSVLDEVPFYRKVVKEALFNSLVIKKFGKGRIKYVGSNMEADFREFAANSMSVDETNDCKRSNLEFGFSRLDGSIYKFKRFVSNSGTRESFAEKMLEESNYQQWQVPCVACGKRSPLDWFQTVVVAIEDSNGNVVDYRLRDTEWRQGCGRDIHCICPHCNGALKRLSPEGIWLPKYPENGREGFHIPSLCSFIVDASELWREFQPVINDPYGMQRFFIRRLALPYSAVGNKVNSNLLDKCKGGFNFIIQPDRAFISGDRHDGPCSMGVDVNSEQFDVRISQVLSNGKRRAVFIAKISIKNVDELHALIERYNVDTCVIDIQPEQALVTDFQENAKCRVWLVKVGNKVQNKTETINDARMIIAPNRTELLDRTYSQFQNGKNILPDNYMEIFNGGLFEEISSPVREMRLDNDGIAYFTWESDGKDHQRFADSYDYLAMRRMDEENICIDSSCVFDYNKAR